MLVHRVCTFLTLLLLAGYAAFMCASIPASSVTPPRPRFEFVYDEVKDDNSFGFVVYHDRETGQEIVCLKDVLDNNFGRRIAVSRTCWTTGRTW
jgi:hypothetical protein